MIFLIIIFSFLAIHYALCALIISKGIKRIKSEKQNEIPDEFISIIIPFRNESGNILKSLESISKQNYPVEKYEVIYVDDNSEDDSLEKINKAEKKCNMKVISVPPDYHYDTSKIRAVKYGIDFSIGEIIVTTDCDCIQKCNWLISMMNGMDKTTGFIAGPVDFVEEESVFKKIQKLEFAGLILSGEGLIGINKPIICNSANLAFRKEAYDLAGGFKIGAKLFSSADEFLMLSIKNKTNYKIKFCREKDAVVYTKSSDSLKEFFDQRKRWANKEWKLYGTPILIQLILVYLFFAGLIFQLLLWIFSSAIFFFIFTASLLIKFISEYQILKYGKGLFYGRKIFKIFFLAEIFHIPYILFSGLSGLIGSFKWKNRKIKS